jgi:hypothetical protein
VSPARVYLEGATALIAAACNGHTSTVQKLLECGHIVVGVVAKWARRD